MVVLSVSGLRKHIKATLLWLDYCQQERIQNGFMIISMVKRKYDS